MYKIIYYSTPTNMLFYSGKPSGKTAFIKEIDSGKNISVKVNYEGVL
jgi:phosphoribosyl-AMP cyclohydrolase